MVKRAAAPSRLIWERLQDLKPAKMLTYRRVIDAAIQIADREGLAAVSMRNVAERLGSGTMSLYRYVQSKDELLDLILDSAYGDIRIPARHSGDWRQDVRRVARATRSALKQHSWLGSLVTIRPPLGPNYLRWFEFLLASTNAPGRDLSTQARMVGTVWAYVAGFVGYELAEMETNRRRGLTEERKRELAAPYLEVAFKTGKFPNLARFVEAGAGEPDDAAFEFGLRAVLTGMTAQ